MKKALSLFAVLGLLFACTPEENNPNGNDNYGDKTVHVTGISLDRTSVTIKEGESVTLVATVTPNNAENKNVTWSTSSEAVATVVDGKVTGIKAGSATITATTEDGGKKATCALSVEANNAPSVTVGADHISAVSVVLMGKANLGSSVATDLKIGFQYSTSAGIMPSNSTTVEAEDADANSNYTTGVTGLEPATKYYFRSFVRQNGQDTYGETKEFTTKALESLLVTNDPTEIEATSAKLNAKLDLTDIKYSNISYGFYWGTSEASQNTNLKGGDIADNAFSSSLANLSHKTQYWYKAYVNLDSQTLYGEVKTFTTDVVPVESVSLDKTEYTFNTIGNTLTLKATVLPADATDKSIEWSSNKEDVASVDANGKVTAKGNGTATITVTTKDQGKTATCSIIVAQYVTEIKLSKTFLTLNEGQEQTVTATVNPDNAADKSLTWTSSDESIAKVDVNGKVTAVSKGSTTIKVTANDGSGVSASCVVSVKDPSPAGAVDLGLSVYWATCNLSESGFVSSPEIYGNYYAWGETKTKSYFSWSRYKFGIDSFGPFSKYNTKSSYGTVDNNTVLDPEDDVARVKLGGNWRMPTEAEWDELRDNCTWTWTTQNGVKGRLVTGPNGNSIFLPAAGWWYSSSVDGAGSIGYYWSSTLKWDSPSDALCILFDQDITSIRGQSRYVGGSVRPVIE